MAIIGGDEHQLPCQVGAAGDDAHAGRRVHGGVEAFDEPHARRGEPAGRLDELARRGVEPAVAGQASDQRDVERQRRVDRRVVLERRGQRERDAPSPPRDRRRRPLDRRGRDADLRPLGGLRLIRSTGRVPAFVTAIRTVARSLAGRRSTVTATS